MCDSETSMPTADHTTEVWKPCFQNIEVSNMGRVRRKHDKRVRKTYVNMGGYPKCSVVVTKGKSKRASVHNLVALAFLGSPPSKKHSVDHINRNKEDNRAVNLRWATSSQQNRNARRPGKKLLPVLRKSGEDSREYDNILDAAYALKTDLNLNAKHYSVHTSIAAAIKSGKRYKGYKWEHVCERPTGRIATIPSLPRYAASECGMIRDLFGYWKRGAVKSGYNVSNVMINGLKHVRFVHRLVAETFCAGHSEKNNVCNHINGCKTDNRSSNLEWTTPSGNIKHAYATGLNRNNCRKINQYDTSTGVLVKTHVSVMSASREVSANHHDLRACCEGRQKTAYGFKWRYVRSEEDSVV